MYEKVPQVKNSHFELIISLRVQVPKISDSKFAKKTKTVPQNTKQESMIDVKKQSSIKSLRGKKTSNINLYSYLSSIINLLSAWCRAKFSNSDTSA